MKKKIIFVYPALPGFVRKDLELLSEKHRVVVWNAPWHIKVLLPFLLFGQFVFLLWHLPGASGIIVSFGGYWAMLPALLGRLSRKPVIVILHGTDCASIPSYGYGNLRKPLLRKVSGLAYRLATELWPVSESLVFSERCFGVQTMESMQGLMHFFPDLNTPVYVIHNGIDVDFWKNSPDIKRNQKLFVAVLAGSQFRLKGGDLIMATAPLLPDCTFYLAGLTAEEAGPELPPNVRCTGRLHPGKLRDLFAEAGFIMQLSVFEGFGLSLAEGMACGCIPIVSNVNALPKIAGKAGFVLGNREPGALAGLIAGAQHESDLENRSLMARHHIVDNFSFQSRKEAINSRLQMFL